MDDKLEAQTNEKFAFSKANEKLFKDTLKKYPTTMAALLPMLWLCQEQNGYLTSGILEYAAERLGLSPVHVYAVAEFYTMYHKKPPGKYHIQLCRTLTCWMCGCDKLKAHIFDRLGIKSGEKTEDGFFSLEEVECLGSCGTAPVMRVNDVYCENLSVERIDEIIEMCRAGEELAEEPMGPR